MKERAFALGIVILAAAIAGCRSQPATRESAKTQPARETARLTASGFDYYLLNLSWSPEFCYSHPSAAECAEHDTFVLHGLWPENNDGTYPENCSSAPGPPEPGNYSDLYSDQGLLEHEWRTHGTCSGLGADDFFATVRKAYKSVKLKVSFEFHPRVNAHVNRIQECKYENFETMYPP